jgi:hypothetical protein
VELLLGGRELAGLVVIVVRSEYLNGVGVRGSSVVKRVARLFKLTSRYITKMGLLGIFDKRCFT